MANLIPHNHFPANMARWSPFGDVDEWMKNMWGQPLLAKDMEVASPILIDVTENEQAYHVRAEIPGVRKEDIKIDVDGSRVAISAETRHEKTEKKGDRIIFSECSRGSTYRSFTLDSAVDESKAAASYKDGILELTLPKKNGKSARQIKVS